MTSRRVPPAPGQESVWDYPRPPRLERATRRVRVVLGGEVIADSTRALRVLETSHPPVYYIPRGDVRPGTLTRAPGASHCEYKGRATYWTVRGGETREVPGGAWSYEHPDAPYEALAGHVAFYPARMDACLLDDEQVTPQPGDFYGGWITRDIVGPFKGEPGTNGW